MRSCYELMVRALTVCFLTILFASSVFSQGFKPCGAQFGTSYLELIQESRFVPDYNECNAIRSTDRTLQMVWYIVLDSLGGTGIVYQNILDNILSVNELFSPIGIQFQICDTVHIPNFEFVDFVQDDHEENMLAAYYQPEVINVYLVNSITDDDDQSGGYAYFPGGPDVMVLVKGGIGAGGMLLPHELGHFFGLFHTFEPAFGDELVDASNCDTTGDLVCDTPANPTDDAEDFDAIDPGCNYIGFPETDANGDFYLPPAHNIMSYAPCMCRFTPGQYNRMLQQYQEFRNYLW